MAWKKKDSDRDEKKANVKTAYRCGYDSMRVHLLVCPMKRPEGSVCSG